MEEITALNVRDMTGVLRTAVHQFTDGMVEPKSNGADWMPRYTASPSYLRYLGDFHTQRAVVEFMEWLLGAMPKDATVYDVGCVCGYTGLPLAMRGYDVAFHDYEGLGLQFVRWFTGQHNGALATSVVPYGQPTQQRDWAIALDVIEHTSNQLGFLRWLKELGRTAVFSFPMATYLPPYNNPLDQWVDGEAILWILERRYNVIEHYVADMRTYVVYE